MSDLVVRKLSDRSEVARIPVAKPTRASVERVIRGLLINMRDDCFVDSSEIEYADAPSPHE